MTRFPVAAFLRRAGWEVRTIAGRRPWTCRLLLRRSGELVTSETEICIEGFQRSGNTFAVIAFQQAQPRIVSIAHHVHAPGPVIAAVEMGKPAVVLIRDPEEAVLSLIIRYPHLTPGQALRGYRRFYAPLVPYRDRVVMGRFEDVVADFGSVVREVNRRFGTAFREFEPTQENVGRVLEELDRWDVNTFGEGERLELGRARPTRRREQVKSALRERYRHPRLASKRSAAERLYESLAGRTGTSPAGY